MFERIRLYLMIAAMGVLGLQPAVALGGGGCGWSAATAEPTSHDGPGDILAVASEAGSFSILTAAVEAAGLSDVLRSDGPLTVLAPTDEAFRQSLGTEKIQQLLKPANRDKLVSVLTYHVLPGRVDSHTARMAGSAKTVQGGLIYPSERTDGGLAINRARVVKADIPAANGVIHAIDRVLIPQPTLAELASSDKRFSTLLAAVKAAGLAETLANQGPFTVLAPTNEAFAALPEGTVATLLKPENRQQLRNILLYHIAPGYVGSPDVTSADALPTVQGGYLAVFAPSNSPGKLRIDGAKVLAADIQAANGTIHAIDRVLMPKASIAQTASGNEMFSTLVAAVEAAGLAQTLDQKGPFTVFAPTNDAFAALPPGTVENLLQPENRNQLKAVLKMHVVPGVVLADEITGHGGPMSAQTAAGHPLAVRVDDGQVRVNDSTVVKADILASNGVIHVIDRVILPPAEMGHSGSTCSPAKTGCGQTAQR